MAADGAAADGTADQAATEGSADAAADEAVAGRQARNLRDEMMR